ncbi:hypothetical protein EV1_004331 [Malus domestica]
MDSEKETPTKSDTMLLRFWSVSSSSALHNSLAFPYSENHHNPIYKRRRLTAPFCLRAQLLDEITQLAHNKVLIAAGVSAAVGQLTKPVTSVILYGKEFDFKAVVQAGGFPSTHSSAMVATATTIGLERGLSDSIFGLTVVYAGLVMYDAQGVRREVGTYAILLNKTLPMNTPANSVPTKDRGRIISQPKTSSSLKSDSLESVLSEEANYFSSKATNGRLESQSNKIKRQITQKQISSGLGTNAEEGLERATNTSTRLKESIGHTEVEVTGGALLGFFVGLVVYAIM